MVKIAGSEALKITELTLLSVSTRANTGLTREDCWPPTAAGNWLHWPGDVPSPAPADLPYWNPAASWDEVMDTSMATGACPVSALETSRYSSVPPLSLDPSLVHAVGISAAMHGTGAPNQGWSAYALDREAPPSTLGRAESAAESPQKLLLTPVSEVIDEVMSQASSGQPTVDTALPSQSYTDATRAEEGSDLSPQVRTAAEKRNECLRRKDISKKAHTRVEKKYRQNLNDKFSLLLELLVKLGIQSCAHDDFTLGQGCLKVVDDPKHQCQPNKGSILIQATRHIERIEQQNGRLREENKTLKGYVSTLEGYARSKDHPLSR
ncbi:MAG: hypothetical protein M1838_004509 [Thelocarpon superellum]|nr:MAG: hypothetical protein M1838_004509 [Thelocarpon superellum]